jgi:hypothetical protein
MPVNRFEVPLRRRNEKIMLKKAKEWVQDLLGGDGSEDALIPNPRMTIAIHRMRF